MHKRQVLEVFLYALNPSDGSPERIAMEKEVENFRDVSLLTAREAAGVMARDG